jgi:hypothetical protein
MHLVGYLYEDYHDARSLEHTGLTLILITPREFKAKRLWSSALKETFCCPKLRGANIFDIMAGNTGHGLMSTENRKPRHTILQMPQLWRRICGNEV